MIQYIYQLSEQLLHCLTYSELFYVFVDRILKQELEHDIFQAMFLFIN